MLYVISEDDFHSRHSKGRSNDPAGDTHFRHAIALPPETPRQRKWRSDSVGRVRQQRKLSRAHDRNPQPALMLRARPGNPSRQHFASLRHEPAQQLDVLVVDVVDLVRAELADLSASEQAAPLTASLAVLALVVASRPRPPLGPLRFAPNGMITPPPLSRRSLHRHRVVGRLRTFTGLPIRRQTARDAPPA